MDETKFDPEKVAKCIYKLIVNTKPEAVQSSMPSCEKLVRMLNRFCGKEKHMIIIHVFVRSQQFELFRTALDVLKPVLVLFIGNVASSITGAKLLFKKTPWIIRKLVAVLSEGIDKGVTGILYNFTGIYFKNQVSKWDAWYEYGIIEVVLQNLWKVKWDFTKPYDVFCVQMSLQLLSAPLLHKRDSISTKIVSLLKPNLIRVTEPLPNEVEEESELFTALFAFLCRIVYFDRSILKFVKRTKIIQLAKSFDLSKLGCLEVTIDAFLRLCRGHCELDFDIGPLFYVDPNLEKYNDTLKWCAADGCQESSDTCKLKRCSGCVDYVTYCSKECQKSDWMIHKRLCKSLQ